MTSEEFEEIVREAIKEIPKKFLDKLDNVDICVEDCPNLEQGKKLKIGKGYLLFGLYEGIPQTERRNYGQVLPDKITIFKKPIERAARSRLIEKFERREIIEIVRDTVWHEIAHHFGMDEKRVREAERKKLPCRV